MQRLVFLGNFYLFVCSLTFSPNTVFKKPFFLNLDHFKIFIEFVAILFLFLFWCFGHKACGILAPLTGD